MISIPLGIFILIYFALLIIIGIFFLINLLHLVHTGTISFWSSLVTVATGAFIVLVVSMSWTYIQTLDWQQPITIGSNNNFSSTL
jgi:hypothetical protein